MNTPILKWAHRIGLLCVLSATLVTEAFATSKPSLTGYPRLLHGPMVGAVGSDHLDIWVRNGLDELAIELKYKTAI